MVSAAGSLGNVLQLRSESALGTDNAEIGEIRYTECTHKTDTKLAVPNPNMGHANWADVSDRPVRYDGVIADAMSLTLHVRAGSSSTQKPPIIYLLESMGLTMTTNTYDTVASPGNGAFTLTTGNMAAGQMGAIYLTNYGYYPFLCGAYDNGTKVVTPMMDLPAASPNGAGVCKMWTIYPTSRPVPTTATLGIRYFTGGYHSSGADLLWTLAGCAATKLDPITVEPQKPCEFKFGISATSITESASARIAPAYIDSEKYQVVGAKFAVGNADTTVGALAGIAYANTAIQKAVLDLGITVTPMPGSGNTTCLAGIQGYWLQVKDPKVTVTKVFYGMEQFDKWNESVTDVPMYWNFQQPSQNTSTPAFGFVCPCCYLNAAPTIDYKSTNYIQATYEFAMTSPNINAAASLPDTVATVPWFFSVGLPYAP